MPMTAMVRVMAARTTNATWSACVKSAVKAAGQMSVGSVVPTSAAMIVPTTATPTVLPSSWALSLSAAPIEV